MSVDSNRPTMGEMTPKKSLHRTKLRQTLFRLLLPTGALPFETPAVKVEANNKHARDEDEVKSPRSRRERLSERKSQGLTDLLQTF